MAYKRILTIQDISCVGQCSMTVAMPILSACGHETCILPTALFSTHTGGFGKPAVFHLESCFTDIWRHWQECGITFDAILVGYLGNTAAVTAVMEIADTLLSENGMLIVDPAMADNGKFYSGFDAEYSRGIKELCQKADIILPNVTEAAILAGMDYQDKLDEFYVNKILDELKYPCVILTGVGFKSGETGVMIQEEGKPAFHYSQERIGTGLHGTGDIFSACFTGALMSGRNLREAVQIAADFTGRCVADTVKDPAHWYGVKFEPLIPVLLEML